MMTFKEFPQEQVKNIIKKIQHLMKSKDSIPDKVYTHKYN